jgi:hypothetical protein
LGPLREAAVALAEEVTPAFLTEQAEWDPFAFIDLCEKVSGGSIAL